MKETDKLLRKAAACSGLHVDSLKWVARAREWRMMVHHADNRDFSRKLEGSKDQLLAKIEAMGKEKP